jgi:hypothetical protein
MIYYSYRFYLSSCIVYKYWFNCLPEVKSIISRLGGRIEVMRVTIDSQTPEKPNLPPLSLEGGLFFAQKLIL